MALIDDINEKKQKKKEALQRANEQSTNIGAFSEVHRAIYEQTNALIELLTSDLDVEVKNPQKEVKVENLDKVEDKLDKLNTTTLENKVDLSPLTDAMKSLKKELEKIPKDKVEIPKVDKVTVSNLKDLEKNLSSIEKAVKAIKFPEMPKLDPKIEVKAPEVKIDLKSLEKRLETVTEAVKAIEFPEIIFPEDNGMELTELVKANQTLQKILSKPFPVPNFPTQGIIDAINDNGSEATYIFSEESSLEDGENIQTGWIDMETVDKYQLESVGGDSFTLTIESSSSPSGAGSTVTSNTTVTQTFYLFNVIARQRYMRFTWTNNTGGTVANAYLAIKQTFGSSDKLSVFPLATDPSDFSQAALVQAVGKGQDPNGSYVNVKANGTLFEHSSEIDGTLPTGSTPAFDASGPIVASNVIDTGWVSVAGFQSQQFHANFNGTAGVKIFLMNASDTSGNNSTTQSFAIPTATTIANRTINVGARFFQEYFRIVVINDSGSNATQWAFNSQALVENEPSIVTSLDQPILDFFPAPIVQTISKGKQPDGDYVAVPADGLAFDTSSTLGASGTFTSDWYDTDGFKEIELYITSDVVSGSDGIEVEFTDDAQATTPTVFPGPKFTFDANAVANGFTIKTFKPALDGFRVKYTNGGTAQGNFFLSATLKTGPTSLTQTSLANDLDQTNLAVLTRAGIWAENDSGQIGNITRSTDTGALRVAVTETEAGIDIAPLETWSTNQSNVGTTATQIVGTPLTGRKSVLVKNRSDSTKVVYIGTSASVTASNGYELAAGEGVTLELSPTGTGIYAISASGTQRVCWLEIGE